MIKISLKPIKNFFKSLRINFPLRRNQPLTKEITKESEIERVPETKLPIEGVEIQHIQEENVGSISDTNDIL